MNKFLCTGANKCVFILVQLGAACTPTKLATAFRVTRWTWRRAVRRHNGAAVHHRPHVAVKKLLHADVSLRHSFARMVRQSQIVVIDVPVSLAQQLVRDVVSLFLHLRQLAFFLLFPCLGRLVGALALVFGREATWISRLPHLDANKPGTVLVIVYHCST